MSTHLESSNLDGEGIELLRAMFKSDAEAGDRRACTILALCKQCERLNEQVRRLKNELEGHKPVKDWDSMMKRSE